MTGLEQDGEMNTIEQMHHHSVAGWLDEPAILLKKIRSGSGDLMEATQ